jgi:hypothetical protein
MRREGEGEEVGREMQRRTGGGRGGTWGHGVTETRGEGRKSGGGEE